MKNLNISWYTALGTGDLNSDWQHFWKTQIDKKKKKKDSLTINGPDMKWKS